MSSFAKSKFVYLFSPFFIASISSNVYANEDKDGFISIIDVSNAYLKSFGFNSTDDELPIKIVKERQKKTNFSSARPPLMDDILIRKTIFIDILNNSQVASQFVKNNSKILNKFVWNDLKLYYGTNSNIRYNLISRINNTTTTLGECVLALMLTTPTDDIYELMKRQDSICLLLNNDTLSQNLEKYLKKYKEIEQSFTSFWSKTDTIYDREYNNFLNQKFYYQSKRLKNLNKSTFALDIQKRIFNDSIILAPFLEPLVEPLFSFSQITNWKDYSKAVMGSFPIVRTVNKICLTKETKATEIILSVFGEFAMIGSIYNSVNKLEEYKDILVNIAARMQDVKMFLYIITQIDNIISSDKTLNENLGDKISSIRKIIELGKIGRTQVGSFVKTLKSLPLYDISYFTFDSSRLLSSFKVFIENKKMFCDAIYELGQIDVFLSMAKLMEKSTRYNDNHTYNFTKFLNKNMSKKVPYLKIKQMWNPLLDAMKVIGNDIEFGDYSSTQLKTMILTGPNAGGKSTYLVGLETSILLSQVFGIAPCDEFIMTPFSRINSYIEVSDDVSTGKSLFMSEVDRIQNHMNILDSLKEDEYSFSIFDEPFKGTNPYEGAAVEYSVLEALSAYKNSLNIVATHYPTMMLLEEKKHNKGFRNYKVFISKDPKTNDIIYHYVIVPGRATQSIAIDLLEKYGYDPMLLQRARDIMNNPKNYDLGF